MSKGALLIACNNNQVDYIKQAIFCAERIKKYLEIPVTLVTSSSGYLYENYKDKMSVFNNIVEIENSSINNYKTFRDGAHTEYKLQWKNTSRDKVYDLSPYDETIVMDTDYILCNDTLKHCFTQLNDMLLYKDSVDLSGWRDTAEFNHISPNGIDFYWATIIYFKKSPKTEMYFNLVTHIKDNWAHYRNLYRIQSLTFRNDFAFSIAAHILNGHMSGNFIGQMPGKKYYSTDKDICYEIKDNTIKLLMQKKDRVDYFPLCIKDCNVHIMNKFSLNRVIDEY